MSSFEEIVDTHIRKNKIPNEIGHLAKNFYLNFLDATKEGGISQENLEKQFIQYLEYITLQCQTPFPFEPYHERLTTPINYSQFSLDFFRPLVLFDTSKIIGKPILSQIENQLLANENVILFANHQTEPDPQFIRLMLEKSHPLLADKMIFVAGHRVTTDPIAVPMSLGCNLLNIHSKKYIDHPPEEKESKQKHNQKTMRMMKELLAKGGALIYVAPSGGRDRLNDQGKIELASFDSKNIEMFRLMAAHSGTPSHFYPLALSTLNLLPPPPKTETTLGEERNPNRAPVFLGFGEELNMETFPGHEEKDRTQRRQNLSDHIFGKLLELYNQFSL